MDYIMSMCEKKLERKTEEHMPKERPTHTTLVDGTVCTITYMTEEAQQPEYLRRLAKSAAEASRHAIEELLAKGIPVASLRDRQLIRLYPDGHEEIIEDLKNHDNSTFAHVRRPEWFGQDYVGTLAGHG